MGIVTLKLGAKTKVEMYNSRSVTVIFAAIGVLALMGRVRAPARVFNNAYNIRAFK